MKKKISTEQTKANIEEIIALLAASPAELIRLRNGLADEALHRPLGPGERSFLETLAHLINCEDRSAAAIYSALLVKEPLMVKIHPERQLGQLVHFETYPVTDLLAYFSFRRQVMLDVLAGLSEKQWGRVTREEGKKRKESVYWQARGLALHELEHLTDFAVKLTIEA